MSNEEYFKIEVKGDVILVTLSGFWTQKVLEQNEKACEEAYNKAVDSFKGRSFIAIANLITFKHPSAETKQLIGRFMIYAQQHGLYRSIQIVDKTLLKSAIASLAEQNLKEEYRPLVVSSMDEAMQAVSKLTEEINS